MLAGAMIEGDTGEMKVKDATAFLNVSAGPGREYA